MKPFNLYNENKVFLLIKKINSRKYFAIVRKQSILLRNTFEKRYSPFNSFRLIKVSMRSFRTEKLPGLQITLHLLFCQNKRIYYLFRMQHISWKIGFHRKIKDKKWQHYFTNIRSLCLGYSLVYSEIEYIAPDLYPIA